MGSVRYVSEVIFRRGTRYLFFLFLFLAFFLIADLGAKAEARTNVTIKENIDI